jgi:hypothetical protein
MQGFYKLRDRLGRIIHSNNIGKYSERVSNPRNVADTLTSKSSISSSHPSSSVSTGPSPAVTQTRLASQVVGKQSTISIAPKGKIVVPTETPESVSPRRTSGTVSPISPKELKVAQTEKTNEVSYIPSYLHMQV